MVTEARGQFEGHISLRKRILTDNLKDGKEIKYLPEMGDDMMLFMKLLLSHMPLKRVKLV